MSSQTSSSGTRPARSLRRTLAAAVLAFEGLVVVFAALVAMTQSSLGRDQSLVLGGALAVVCFLAAGLLRSPIGVVLGWVLQVVIVLTGVWVPMMFFLGVVFGALWVTALRIGGRIDREKAAYAEAHLVPRAP
jgi:hypothetical protein